MNSTQGDGGDAHLRAVNCLCSILAGGAWQGQGAGRLRAAEGGLGAAAALQGSPSPAVGGPGGL